MRSFRTTVSTRPVAGFFAGGLLSATALVLCVTPALAHQLWIETGPSAEVGKEHEIHVCWGHSGHKETGPSLAGQQSKLTACVRRPGGREPLNLAKGEDCFTAKVTPGAPGCHVVGADLQVGIIDQELHGIPAKTRIVMYGKSFIRVGGHPENTMDSLGFELEIVPVALTRDPKAGDLLTVRVLRQGKPIGGRNVLVSAATSGPQPPPEDPRLQTSEWSIEAMADPRTGDVTFPLIVAGQHVFVVRYFDETPGTYEGDRNDRSAFSHLRRGDAYERTMYVSTLTVPVNAK
jgi:uncharacterized GH25 family protein